MWQVLSDVRESKRQQSSSSACGDEKEKKEEKSCEFCALQRNSLQVPSHPIYGFCYLLSSAPLMLVGPTPRPHPELHAGGTPQFVGTVLKQEIVALHHKIIVCMVLISIPWS